MAGSSAGARPSQAAARGASWLLAASESGRWRGFPTLAGESDVWVTAFVAAHLRTAGVPAHALATSRAFLRDARLPGGGWSYGADVPPDADSTSWCLIALRGTRYLPAAAAREAYAFLASHATASGVTTYLDDGRIRAYIKAPPSVSVAGWTSPHPDVTAAAMLAGTPSLAAPDGLSALGRLILRQSGAGLWDAYWWRGPLYTTALVLRAVHAAGVRLPHVSAGRLLRALEREQLPDGGFGLGASREPDPFTTALGLECLCRLAYIGGADRREVAVSSLLLQQQPDGSWPGDYVMRIPAPDVLEPRHVAQWSRATGGGNSYVLDTRGTFATALACHALGLVKGAGKFQDDRPEIAIAPESASDEVVVSLGS